MEDTAPAYFWNKKTGKEKLFPEHPVGGKPPAGYQDSPVKVKDGNSSGND